MNYDFSVIMIPEKSSLVHKPPQENAEVFLDNDSVICRLLYRTRLICILGR
jgi:hypothetical protein